MDKENKYAELDRLTDLMCDICDILYMHMGEDEYYKTCGDVFRAIEKKHLDISHIVPNEEYEDFKKKVFANRLIDPCIGKAPEPKYDIRTAEGIREYMKDHPELNNCHISV